MVAKGKPAAELGCFGKGTSNVSLGPREMGTRKLMPVRYEVKKSDAEPGADEVCPRLLNDELMRKSKGSALPRGVAGDRSHLIRT